MLSFHFSMPYIEAVALESLRMFIARAFGVPHRSVRDTTLSGYFIPKVIPVTGLIISETSYGSLYLFKNFKG